jgi:hypothetical protein
MNDINDGGPAFPVFPETGGWIRSAFQGMTLRDYFAARAMQSLLIVDGTTHFDIRAKEAYDVADAMLKARKEQK